MSDSRAKRDGCDEPASGARRRPEQLRSYRWFGPDTMRAFGHRSRLKGMGFDDADYRGKPVIGILNTWSDLNTCHAHLRQRADEIKRGVLQAGGFPVEVPVMSLGEMLMKPTTMLYRNLLAMETEEVLRCHPIDAAVLMGGCDKTTPGLLMGAFSADLPVMYFPCGPMITARWKGQTLGSGSDAFKYWTERCAGNLCDTDWRDIENSIAASTGHCMTMGTASTMTSMAEVLGMTLSGGASIPAVAAEHSRLAVRTGRRIVELAWADVRPSAIVTRASFLNAVTALMALGGSTNAIVHLIAMAGRLGIELTLDDFDRISRSTPTLANVRPSGEKYLMEDFYHAGGLRALLKRIAHLLDLSCQTVDGVPLGECLRGAEVIDEDVIRPLERPLAPEGGVCVLRGNLAPSGCVLKQTAASPELLRHRGPAVVFENYNDLERRIDDPDLAVAPQSVLVLKNAGPLGAPGFPEWGMLPIPKKLLQAGVRDMVRISDARMSGTSYGTCVLHVAPEAAAGGPLALVRDGDLIELDVPNRRIELLVGPEELARRRAEWKPPEPHYARGYGWLYTCHVRQADLGCDFDFLEHGPPTPEPEIH